MAENQLSILTYHAIDERESVISVPPERFRRQMTLLAESNIRGISLAQAFESQSQTGRFPDRSVVLTFDDGFRSVFEQALPVMNAVGFSGTAFIPADFVGLSAAQAEKLNKDLDRDVMNWHQIEELEKSGFEIGAHSMSHPDLRRLPAEQLERELSMARSHLEARLQHPVRSFAYPYGSYDARVKNAVSGHYNCACTTRLGSNQPAQDPMLLRRLDVYYLKRERAFMKACTEGLDTWWRFRQALRDIKTFLR